MKTAIILNCGAPIAREIDADKIICADGGLDFCPVRPDYLVGDCDSVRGVTDGIPVLKHPSHKNYTDGESAVRFAKELGADEIVMYGVTGGRYDHTLGNFAVMFLALSLGMKCSAREKDADIYALSSTVSPDFSLDVRANDVISVLPHGGDAVVTDSEGLEYPLENLTLTCRDSRGISNCALADRIHIRVAAGEALLFRNIRRT